MSDDFIGRGWAFPLRTSATSGIAMVEKARELAESIQLILSTAFGERPMRPEFGCGIHEYVFAPADDTTAGQLAYEVRLSLQRWEPRVTVTDVVVTVDPDRANTLYIDINYVERSTNDPRNLVFPFYTIPPEGEGPR
jgi:phage baseplate assembly protein W